MDESSFFIETDCPSNSSCGKDSPSENQEQAFTNHINNSVAAGQVPIDLMEKGNKLFFVILILKL